MNVESTPLGLIVNARTGRVRRHLVSDRFWERLLSASDVVLTRDLDQLDAAVMAMRARRVRVIACLGGDGSLSQLLRPLLRHYTSETMPLLLPLAGGTLNGLARAFGSGGAPEAVLIAALDQLAAGEQASRGLRVLRVAAPGSCHHGFTFAAGLAARAVARYDQGPGTGAVRVAAVALGAGISAVAGGRFATPARLRISLNGRAPCLTLNIFVAGVVENPFLGVRPFGPGPPPVGMFQFAALSMPPRQIALRLWPILRGRCRNSGIVLGVSRSASVECGEGFVLDGELFFPGPQGPLSLTLGPELRFMDLRRQI